MAQPQLVKIGSPWTRSMIRGSMDPVHILMDPVSRSMDPVNGGGPWTRGPCFVLSQVVVGNCIAWHRDKENNVVYTNFTWPLAFRPKQTVHNCCSRGYVVPLFSSKKRELFTGDNLGRSSDAFSSFSCQRNSSFECRTTVPPWRPIFCHL